MKNAMLFFALFLFLAGIQSNIFAQSEPVLYFCEKYDDQDGEIGVADRFTTGYLTVMVKCDYALNLEDVRVQFDKYNFRTGQFDYYKKYNYTIEKDMNYVFFAKNDDSDLKFDEPGFYRVFLLDKDDKTVASALIEIIE
jgi:hypothetical protein